MTTDATPLGPTKQSPDQREVRAQLGPVPSLQAVMADPSLVRDLPRPAAIEYRRALKRLDADLEARIASTEPAEAANPADSDRAIGLTEASTFLDMKRRTLERKWRQLGGYRDVDGHIKFRLGVLRRHVARRSTSLG